VRFYNDPVEISADVWAEVLVDRTVTEERDLIVLRLVYESVNHEMHASEIAPHLNYTGHAPVNARIARFSKRVAEKTGVRLPMNDNGAPRWWNVPFWGCDKDNGMCSWIMRPELVEAYERVFGQSDSELVYPGEMTVQDSTVLSEGTVSKIFVNHYERDKQARTKCIEHYGCRCAVCGFDFERIYGPIGQNKIHVHHLIPLSGIRREYKIDPIRDLRPVCPNCHLIIHSQSEPFTIEEMREMINSPSPR
jgi:5-methylcytosine-specific restriction protein A